MANTHQASHLPSALTDLLDRLIARVRRLQTFRGLGLTVAAAVSVILVAMAGDALFPGLPGLARLIWPFSILAVTAWTAWRTLVKPLRAPMTRERMARLVETRHPDFDEKLSTAIELSGTEGTFSSSMLNAVVQEAAGFTGSVTPEAEFDPGRLRRVGVVAAGPLAVLIIAFLLWPGIVSRLLSRVLMPFADDASAFAAQVDVQPGNDVILRHSAWTLAAEFSVDLEDAPVWDVRQEDGSWLEERLQPLAGDDGERFGLRLPEVETSFTYRVRSGRIQSEVYDVTVVDPPMVTCLVTRVVFPTYAKRADLVLTNPVGVVMAVVGGTLEVEAQLNKPATEASLTAMQKAWPVEAGPGARSIAMTVAPERAGESVLQWHLVDEHGFKGGSPPLGLRVLADQPPQIDLLRPVERELRMNPKDTLGAKVLIEEDFGVAALEWMVALPGKPFEPIPARMPVLREGRKTLYDGKPTLPLAALDLSEAGSFRVRLRVSDNRPESLGGTQYGTTEIIEVIVDRQADRIAEKMLKEQYEKAKDALKETQQAVKKAEQRMKETARMAQQDRNEQQRQTRAERALEEAQAAEAQAAKAEAEVEDTSFSELAEKLAELRREKLEEARQAAEQAALAEDPKEMEQAAKAAEKALAEAQEELNQLAVELGEKKEDVDRFLELNEQVADQAALADEAQDAASEGEAPAEDWEKRQEELIGDVADLIEQKESDKAAFESALSEARETLGEQAAELAEQQQTQADASREAAESAASEESPSSPPEKASALSEALAKQQEAVAETIREQAQQAAAEAATEKALDESFQESGQTGAKQEKPEPSAAAQAAAEKAEALSQAADQAEAAAEALREGDWEKASEQARAAAETLAEEAGVETGGEPGSEAGQESGSEGESPAGEAGEQAAGEEAAGESGSEAGQESGSESESPAGEAGEQAAGEESAGESGSEAGQEAGAESEGEGGSDTGALAEAQDAVADAIEAAAGGEPEAALGLGQEALSSKAATLAEQGQALDSLAEKVDLPPTGEEGLWEQIAEAGKAAESAAGDLAEALGAESASEPGSEAGAEAGSEGEAAGSEAGEAGEAAGTEGESSEGSASGESTGALTEALAAAQGEAAEALAAAAEALSSGSDAGEGTAAEGSPAEAAGQSEAGEAAGESPAPAGDAAGAALPVVDPGLALEALGAAAKAQASAAAAREDAAAAAQGSPPPSGATPPAAPGQQAGAPPPGSSQGAPSSGQQAAQQAQQAAAAMQDLADAMAERLGIRFPEKQSAQSSSQLAAMESGTMQGDASQEPGSEDSVPMAEGKLVLDDSPLGQATRDWEAFLGQARSGTGSSDYGNLSRDYQALVRRYFEAVARESANASEKEQQR